ncbi:BREX-1 system adenine-specific DNA-methyltransferase PglX [Flavobacteriaceae bacterium]|nr:BREX-1 system adenine-specific DNA-methyltransferase PglX [Flavobacteriaceae bacterium]
MAIFQNTVVNKYLNNQNEHVLSEKWNIYKTHFFDPKVQENIRDSKEEEYQEGFMRDLFVNVLGYTLKPKDNYNLVLEKKNVKDSKKADAAIAIDNKIFGVIELKGTYVTDLSSVETQAFGYKVNHTKDCIYVITSNFEKLRFYIDNTIDHIEFNLFTLTEQEFKLLYLCLAFENVKNQIPKKLKEGSLSQEEEITKQLYKDYSLFKRELFQDLTKQNPQFEPLELFKKSQKLLDRFLFLFFAEDRNLLPPNSVRLILTQWKQLKDLDAYSPLYERFKKYFGYLNTGFKGKQYDIFAYNGGLFKPDEVLANIVIDDELLYKHTLKLADYDFVSEIDVNILGHIFENSLNELDEVKAQLEGTAIDKSTTKRKKDGVFYTPKYITKYIVEHTVGKLCHEKKTALSIIEADYFTDKKRQKKTIKPLVEKLKQYRDWLLQLTICDPACGSGAFLNEVLNFLITEHGYIDELQAKLFGDAMVLSDVENSILENNLFGVDINEESVEIAKLSLWLRTAQPNRKLNNLNNNIKCGNSLIDDITVAGDKAFNWENEFPQVFAKGGFDVVIGNPPYVDSESMTKSYPNERNFISKNYESASGNWDLFIPFIERGIQILKNGNYLSFIIPNKVLTANYGTALRNLINKSYSIEEIYDLSKDNVFSVDVYPVILFISKTPQSSIVKISKIEEGKAETFEINFKHEENWALYQNLNYKLYAKIIANNNTFDNNKTFSLYSAATVSEAYEIKEFIEDKDTTTINQLKLINSGTIDPYLSLWGFKPITYIKERYSNPIINIQNIKDKEWTKKPKIAIAGMALRIEAFLDIEGAYLPLKSTTVITANTKENLKYICAILNSKLLSFLFRIANSANTMAGGYLNVNKTNLNDLPIIYDNTVDVRAFSNLADQMLSLNKDLQKASSKFQRTLQREFEVLEKLPKKLENWHELTFADFIKELKKKKIELSFDETVKWEDYFLPEQQKALEIKAQITKTDKEIDAMVYVLYGLTNEEIVIVENA